MVVSNGGTEPGATAVLTGRYTVVRELGRGGMGVVHLARDQRLHRLVAVKRLRPDLAGDERLRAAFLREARLAAGLDHPGIVPVYDLGEDGGLPYLVLRFQSGPSLAARLGAEGRLEPELVRHLLGELARVLEYAHGHGLVHRDLKPENVFLEGPADRPRPVLGDFGVAFRAMSDSGPGQRRLAFGTAHFMAPEQAAGDHDVDHRADLFALGVIGYLLLTGSVPYDGTTESAISAARIAGRREPLGGRSPDAPPDLVAAIERCLEPDPAARFPKAADLVAALRAGPAATRPRPWRRRRRAPAASRPVTTGAGVATVAHRPISPSIRREVWIHLMITEIKFAVRSLRQTPAVALAAVLCLALGLGATTAISSAVNAALLAPLPFAKPDRLVSVFRTTPHFRSGPFSPPNFRDLAREARVVEGLAAMGTGSAVLETSDGGVQIPVVGATGSLFPTLGARARVGRLLGPTDEDPAEPLTVVLGYDLWVGRFGGSPEVIGQTVRLDGTPRIVVGVTPDGFRVPHGGNLIEPEAWVPLRFTSDQLLGRRNNHLMVLGRLRDGATVAAARGEMDQLMGRLVAAHPELSGEGIAVESMAAAARAPIRTPLLLLFGAVGLVLVIAAANVASLLLARGTGRRRELAVRAALGASRGDIVRRVLAETGVLVAAGTAGGLVLALLGVRVIGSMAAVRFPQLADLGLDWPAVGFALLLALVVTAACGLVPALRAAAVDPQETLRASDQRTGVGARHHRFLRGIAVAEVALSLTLLVDAGLVIRGFVALTNQPPGFDPAPLLTLQVAVPARGADDRPADRFLEPALAAVAEVPGVESVGVIDLLPYAAWGNNFNVRYEGRVPEADPTRAPLVERRIVSPGLFAALGMAPVAGRLFEPGDGPDAPLVIVANRALAVRDFGGRNPIGQRIQLGSTTFATIVGVVGDIKNAGPERAPAPEVYFSYRQTNRGASAFSFVVRAQGDPAAVAGPASAAIRQADPSAAVGRIRPMTEVVARSVGRPRFLVTLLGAFAAVAVVLAMAGLYGLMSYTVAQRRREIGIRMALGSGAGRTVGLVLGQGGRLVAIGMALGLAGGVATSRLLAGLLYGVSPGDLGTWAATIGVLAATALLALLVPARRATATDPVEVIRD